MAMHRAASGSAARPPRNIVAVVGATGTIGRAICQKLVASGDLVVAVARDCRQLKALCACLPQGLQVVSADLSSQRSATALGAKLAAIGVTGVVFCVGPFPRSGIEDVSFAKLSEACAVHAFGPLMVLKALKKQLVAAHGSVVALSDEGVRDPFPNHVAYLAAKGALDASMRALAVELAPHVRINVVRPCVVTDPESTDCARSDRLARRSLLRRLGSPEEVADVVIAMLRSTFVSGRSWTVG